MKLYHGTNGAWVDHILRVGLRPRGERAARGNWKDTVQSHPGCVYLTDAYAPHFAIQASRGKEPTCAVFEVDTDRLDQRDLFPDEDFLEQGTRRVNDGVTGTMLQRTRHYRRHLFDYGEPRLDPDSIAGDDPAPKFLPTWRFSIRYLGTCAHRGPIPPEAITRVVTWPDTRANVTVRLAWDLSVSLVNYRWCGPRYRALTRKLFDGEFTDPKLLTREELVDLTRRAALDEPELTILAPIEGWKVLNRDLGMEVAA